MHACNMQLHNNTTKLVTSLCNSCRLYKGVPFICLGLLLKWKIRLSFSTWAKTFDRVAMMMQLNNRFRQAILLLLLISPVSLFAAPLLSDPQTTIAQCQEIQCEPASCDNPVRLDGQCCPICVEPGIYIYIYESLNHYSVCVYGVCILVW